MSTHNTLGDKPQHLGLTTADTEQPTEFIPLVRDAKEMKMLYRRSSTNTEINRAVSLGDIVITDPEELRLEYDGCATFVTTLCAEVILLARQLPRLHRIINSGRVTIDGTWTMWVLRCRLGPTATLRKLSGADLIYDVTMKAVSKGRRVMLLGGDQKANADAVRNLGAMSGKPHLVTGYSPQFLPLPFPEFVQEEIRRQIAKERPDILILGLGVPKQEYWAEDNRSFLRTVGVSYVMFFGGAIDFAAGKYRRAPRWVQQIGLESLIRLIQNPRRWRRELSKLSFIWLLITNRL